LGASVLKWVSKSNRKNLNISRGEKRIQGPGQGGVGRNSGRSPTGLLKRGKT